jgi:uncharacterized membrane-anchored protein YjiN (DUF445 family)
MKALIAIFLVFFVSYLFGAFVSADFNSANWNPYTRFVLATIDATILGAIAVESTES